MKGISFTMGMIVSALVIIATAVLVLGVARPSIMDTGSELDEQREDRFGDIDVELMRNKCEQRMQDYCGSGGGSNCPEGVDQGWACQAQVDGRYCYEYWDGSYAAIPSCDSGFEFGGSPDDGSESPDGDGSGDEDGGGGSS